MRGRKIAIILLLIALSTGLCGCWDVLDIGNLAFPIAAAYDVHQGNPNDMNQLNQGPEEMPEVDVTILFPNLSTNARSSITMETLPGASVAYTRSKRPMTTANPYATGFNKVILTGEDLARKDLSDPLESLTRFPPITHTMLLAVVEGRGQDILSMEAPNHENMGLYLYDLLRDLNENSPVPSVNIHQFKVGQAPGFNPVVPMLKAGGVNNVFVSGIAVFNKDRMIGKVDLHQSRALAWLRGIPAQDSLRFNLGGKEQGTAVVANKRKVKVKREGDQYIFEIEVSLTGTIVERFSQQSLEAKLLEDIQNDLARDASRQCEVMVRRIQEEFKVDCIDINKYAMAKWRRELKDRIDSEEFISKAVIKVKVDVKLSHSGEAT